ncbi:group XIIB secretory phospholipase A2-like protein [Uranotaenia lowii]|uniref:group XIIB secretory phospholipase A2-like protein n=1 Tax=Uranotaenia lowii TaxID=190385 RepID=UPI002479DE32|nr:group XIIB secretory phospholipase A2-like protein [Uranotaenia lowii]XP_055599171.1 group XIIB secretory phospholipase A2-like protein [Uranotaenia lowii]
MQIPYMKVAIYSLTFLTYAYTGYGSNMLSSLRDAIIAAEAVFGDVLKNVVHVAKKFKVVHEVFDAAVEENCVYKCPGGSTPSRNKFYIPQSDGCGSLGLKIDTEYLPAAEMETCCNAHDICYDTCNSDKELCDLDFKRCLYKYCDEYEKNVVGDIVVKGCKAAAKMLFTGTITLGCKSYLDSQARSCYCVPEKPTAGAGQQQPGTNPNQDKSAPKDKAYERSDKAYDRAYERSDKYYDKGYKEKDKPGKYGWKNDL